MSKDPNVVDLNDLTLEQRLKIIQTAESEKLLFIINSTEANILLLQKELLRIVTPEGVIKDVSLKPYQTQISNEHKNLVKILEVAKKQYALLNPYIVDIPVPATTQTREEFTAPQTNIRGKTTKNDEDKGDSYEEI